MSPETIKILRQIQWYLLGIGAFGTMLALVATISAVELPLLKSISPVLGIVGFAAFLTGMVVTIHDLREGADNVNAKLDALRSDLSTILGLPAENEKIFARLGGIETALTPLPLLRVDVDEIAARLGDIETALAPIPHLRTDVDKIAATLDKLNELDPAVLPRLYVEAKGQAPRHIQLASTVIYGTAQQKVIEDGRTIVASMRNRGGGSITISNTAPAYTLMRDIVNDIPANGVYIATSKLRSYAEIKHEDFETFVSLLNQRLLFDDPTEKLQNGKDPVKPLFVMRLYYVLLDEVDDRMQEIRKAAKTYKNMFVRYLVLNPTQFDEKHDLSFVLYPRDNQKSDRDFEPKPSLSDPRIDPFRIWRQTHEDVCCTHFELTKRAEVSQMHIFGPGETKQYPFGKYEREFVDAWRRASTPEQAARL